MPTEAATFIPLASTFLGGLIGLAGGIVVPRLNRREQLASERSKREEEKLLEMVEAVYRHKYYLTIREGILVFGNVGDPGLSPLALAQSIAVVYFQELISDLATYETEVRNYELWMLAGAKKRHAGEPAEQWSEGLTEVYSSYLDAIRKLLDTLTKHAKKREDEIQKRRWF